MKMQIQSMRNLKKEMLSVARGERKAPADAAQISFESVEAVIQLTPAFDLDKLVQAQHIQRKIK